MDSRENLFAGLLVEVSIKIFSKNPSFKLAANRQKYTLYCCIFNIFCNIIGSLKMLVHFG